MRGQVDFDGFEIQSDTIKVPGLGTIPLAKIKADLDVHAGDAVDVRMRFYIGAPAFATGGMDGKGNFKGEFDRHFTAYADQHEFEIVRYVPKDERDQSYRDEHGAA